MELELDLLRSNGLEIPADVTRAELVEGRVDLARQAQDECPVCGGSGGACVAVLYLYTNRGTVYGSGAGAGFLCRAHIDCVDWTIASANVGTRRDVEHDGAPVCEDCILACDARIDARRYPRLSRREQAPCWSCVEMARQSEAEACEDAARESL